MGNDIGLIIDRINRSAPNIIIRQHAPRHAADDAGLWFFSTDKDHEVQLESSSGSVPFLVESSRNADRYIVSTIDEAVQAVLIGLDQRPA